MSFHALISQLHEELAARGFAQVRPAFAFVLLAARERPMTGNDVAELMAMTKQAASKLVDAMEAERLIVRKPDPNDARAKRLFVTPQGERLLLAAEQIYRELEVQWAAVLGAKRVETLRTDLEQVLRATHGGSLPPIRPIW